MAELASSFEKAQSNIEPSDEDWENAPEAHKAIADILGENETLKKWGINPILIGSYGRRVSIRRVYDVDMFCRLDSYPEGVAADEVLDRVYEVLVDAYDEKSVTREDRSVTVLVPDADGLYVDVVPAREVGSVWEIPTEGGEWIATNPVEMAELKEDKNADFDEMYVPCVKLLRQARRTLLGKTKPGGFAVEMAFFTACEEGLVTKTTSMTQFFASAMEASLTCSAASPTTGSRSPTRRCPARSWSSTMTPTSRRRPTSSSRPPRTLARPRTWTRTRPGVPRC